ncbi:hypothetical protein [Piscinibacter sakaiensis]|uniref:hypothetical protein n=1 Tax=Piscinibacter sakaiensis TaxID=1547922 RepID=UPI003AAF75AE
MNHFQGIVRLTTTLLLGLLTANGAAAAGCAGPEHRQFDFWIGEWEVRTPDGKVAGINRIRSDYEGCVVRERYETATGYRGESLNAYDPGRKRWHQTWVDNKGGVLLLEGGLRNGNMVLEGQTTAVDGTPTKQRISWTPRADGTVTQLWEASTSDGQWSIVFYGIYWKR